MKQKLPDGVERINTKALIERAQNQSGFAWKTFDVRIDFECGITEELAKKSIEVHWESDDKHYCAVKERSGRMWVLNATKIQPKKRSKHYA